VPDLVALLRTFHGWLGLLAVVLLLHPVVALRGADPARIRKGLRWSAGLALTVTGIAYASGWWLYPGYRVDTKPLLLADAPDLARAFESKEHLCFYALALTLAGGALLVAGRTRAVRWCFGLASGLALVGSVLGALVGAFRGS
jgi:hypothetical protein